MKRGSRNLVVNNDEDDESNVDSDGNDEDDDDYVDAATPKHHYSNRGDKTPGGAVTTWSNDSSHEGLTGVVVVNNSILASELVRRAKAASQHYERLERRRASNRLSKRRCRGQKREIIASYQAQFRQLTNEFKQLTQEKDELQKELVKCLLSAEEEQKQQQPQQQQEEAPVKPQTSTVINDFQQQVDSGSITNTTSLLQAVAAATSTCKSTDLKKDEITDERKRKLSPSSSDRVGVGARKKAKKNPPLGQGLQGAAVAAAAVFQNTNDILSSHQGRSAESMERADCSVTNQEVDAAASAKNATNTSTAIRDLHFAVGAAVYSSLVAAAAAEAAAVASNNNINTDKFPCTSLPQAAAAVAAGLPLSHEFSSSLPRHHVQEAVIQEAVIADAKETTSTGSIANNMSSVNDPMLLLYGGTSIPPPPTDPLLLFRGMINNSAISSSMLPHTSAAPTAAVASAAAYSPNIQQWPSSFMLLDSQHGNACDAAAPVRGGEGANNPAPPRLLDTQQPQGGNDIFSFLSQSSSLPTLQYHEHGGDSIVTTLNNDSKVQAFELLLQQHRLQQQRQQQEQQEQLLSFLSRSFQQQDR